MLTAILEQHGHDVEFFLQDVDHLPEQALTDLLDREHYDMVGLSFIGGYWQYHKAIAISAAINKSKNRPFFAIGGHGPSPEPEYFMRMTGADAVCIGEGDETILDLCKVVSKEMPLSKVKGIAYRDGDNYYVNERRPLIKDIDAIPYISILKQRSCRYLFTFWESYGNDVVTR